MGTRLVLVVGGCTGGRLALRGTPFTPCVGRTMAVEPVGPTYANMTAPAVGFRIGRTLLPRDCLDAGDAAINREE
jgi:hypothetical protein